MTGVVLNYIIQYCTVSYCIVSYCIILYHVVSSYLFLKKTKVEQQTAFGKTHP